MGASSGRSIASQIVLDMSTTGPSKDWQCWHHTNQSHEKLNHFTPSKLYPEPIPRLIRLRGKDEDAASQLREKVNAAAIAAPVAAHAAAPNRRLKNNGTCAYTASGQKGPVSRLMRAPSNRKLASILNWHFTAPNIIPHFFQQRR